MTTPSRFPMELADRCVKCGLCLPHCPTYGLARVEGESPRGRIALMQGLATGRLEPGPSLVRHLDNCLGCRACEKVCPADVPYGELIDAGRALLVERGVRPPFVQRLFRRLLRQPRTLALAARLGRLRAVAAAARRIGGWPGRAVALLPADARPPQASEEPPTGDETRGEVLLFAGCVGAAIDGRSLDDTRRALHSAGWRVRMPPRQGCCGAIDLHAGRPEAARAHALRNVRTFAGEGPVIVCATGCAATLREYARLAGPDGVGLARRVRDPAELLAGAKLALTAGRFRRVVLHVPCTQRNVTGTAGATRRLLARIDGLAVRELPAGCCGAAGEMILGNPRLSDALLAPLLEELGRDPPDALITSNIGCAMHFTAGLGRAGLAIPVLHPASLVVDALECAS
jgi:glycolate oxidase iron-sulfur subunit